jgi:hypothetical protein
LFAGIPIFLMARQHLSQLSRQCTLLLAHAMMLIIIKSRAKKQVLRAMATLVLKQSVTRRAAGQLKGYQWVK